MVQHRCKQSSKTDRRSMRLVIKTINGDVIKLVGSASLLKDLCFHAGFARDTPALSWTRVRATDDDSLSHWPPAGFGARLVAGHYRINFAMRTAQAGAKTELYTPTVKSDIMGAYS